MNDFETATLQTESPDNNENTAPEKKPFIALAYDYIETFCYALAVMVVLVAFVFRIVSVNGESMLGTLEHGDRLIISNMFYTPETGDIIVINPEDHGNGSEPIIKRVIATEGQRVLIDYNNWAVYVDGVKLDEPYIEEMREFYKKIYGYDVPMNGTNVVKYRDEFIVGDGMVFVMGDNRNNSRDSRDSKYGEMSVNSIIGRVIVRISPEFGLVE